MSSARERPVSSLGGGIHVIDLAVMTNGHERIETGLEQASIVGARQPRLTPAGLRLGSALFYQAESCPAVKAVMKKAASAIQFFGSAIVKV